MQIQTFRYSFKQEENPFAYKTIFITTMFSISPFIIGCVSICVREKDLIESLC